MTNCTNFLNRPGQRVELNLLCWILAITFIPMVVSAQTYSSRENSLQNDSDIIDDIVVKRILVLAEEGVVRITCKKDKDCITMASHECIQGICRPSAEQCRAIKDECKRQDKIYLPQNNTDDCRCVECTSPAHCQKYTSKASKCIENKCQTPPADCKEPNIQITLTDGTPHCVKACSQTEKDKCKGKPCANGICLNSGQCFNEKDCSKNKYCYRKRGSGQLGGTCGSCSENEHCKGPGPNGTHNPSYEYWCDVSKEPVCSSQCGRYGECKDAGGTCKNRACHKNSTSSPTGSPSAN